MTDSVITVNDPRTAIAVIIKALQQTKDWWPKDQATHILRELDSAGFKLEVKQ